MNFFLNSIKLFILNIKYLNHLRAIGSVIYSKKKSNWQKRNDRLNQKFNQVYQKMGFKVKVITNNLKINPKKKYFIFCNHENALDPVIVNTAMLKLKIYWYSVANKEILKVPYLSRLAKYLDAMYINRISAREAVSDAKKIIARAKKQNVLIYPQGALGTDVKPKIGAIQIAKKTKNDIIFLKIKYQKQLFDKDKINFKNNKAIISIEKIIKAKDFYNMKNQAISELFYNTCIKEGKNVKNINN